MGRTVFTTFPLLRCFVFAVRSAADLGKNEYRVRFFRRQSAIPKFIQERHDKCNIYLQVGTMLAHKLQGKILRFHTVGMKVDLHHQ